MDVQHRKPVAGDRDLPGTENSNQSSRDLDGSWRCGLAYLCSSHLGNAVLGKSGSPGGDRSTCVDDGASRRVFNRDDGVAPRENGQKRVALCVWLVLHRAVAFTPGDARSHERQCFSANTGRLGANLQRILEVLAGTDADGWGLYVDLGDSAQNAVA